jgi:hypothetical protein
MLLTVCSVAERSKDDATQKFVMMEGATRNGVYTVLKGVYTRSLDESRVYEKEVEIFKRRTLKSGEEGGTLLCFCCLGTDVMNLERAEQKREGYLK